MTSSAPRGRVLEVTQAEALGDAATEEEKLDEQKRQEMSLLLQTHSEVAVALGKFETWVNHGSMVGDSVGLVLTGFFEANADINNRIGAVFDLYGNPFPRSLSYAPMFTIHTLLKMKKDEKANPSRNPNLTAALKHFPTDRRQFRQFRYALLGRRAWLPRTFLDLHHPWFQTEGTGEDIVLDGAEFTAPPVAMVHTYTPLDGNKYPLGAYFVYCANAQYRTLVERRPYAISTFGLFLISHGFDDYGIDHSQLHFRITEHIPNMTGWSRNTDAFIDFVPQAIAAHFIVGDMGRFKVLLTTRPVLDSWQEMFHSADDFTEFVEPSNTVAEPFPIDRLDLIPVENKSSHRSGLFGASGSLENILDLLAGQTVADGSQNSPIVGVDIRPGDQLCHVYSDRPLVHGSDRVPYAGLSSHRKIGSDPSARKTERAHAWTLSKEAPCYWDVRNNVWYLGILLKTESQSELRAHPWRFAKLPGPTSPRPPPEAKLAPITVHVRPIVEEHLGHLGNYDFLSSASVGVVARPFPAFKRNGPSGSYYVFCLAHGPHLYAVKVGTINWRSLYLMVANALSFRIHGMWLLSDHSPEGSINIGPRGLMLDDGVLPVYPTVPIYVDSLHQHLEDEDRKYWETILCGSFLAGVSSVTSIRLTPGIIDANRVLSGAQICSRGFLRSGYPGTLRRDYFATANDHDDTCDELDEGSAYPF